MHSVRSTLRYLTIGVSTGRKRELCTLKGYKYIRLTVIENHSSIAGLSTIVVMWLGRAKGSKNERRDCDWRLLGRYKCQLVYGMKDNSETSLGMVENESVIAKDILIGDCAQCDWVQWRKFCMSVSKTYTYNWRLRKQKMSVHKNKIDCKVGMLLCDDNCISPRDDMWMPKTLWRDQRHKIFIRI